MKNTGCRGSVSTYSKRIPLFLKKGEGNAFTLIELLVVIAIIAILAAMLLPVLKSAQDKALTTDCATRLKEIQMSIMSYEGDNDNWILPYHFNNGKSDGTTGYWMRFLTNNGYWKSGLYAKDAKVWAGITRNTDLPKNFNCPLDTRERGGFPTTPANKNEWYDYGMNAHVRGNWSSTSSVVRRAKTTVLTMPGKCFSVLDASQGGLLYTDTAKMTYRHGKNGEVNMAYFDGHVGWLSSTPVVGKSTDETLTKVNWYGGFGAYKKQGE